MFGASFWNKKLHSEPKISSEQKSFLSNVLNCIWQQCPVLLLVLIGIAARVKDRGPVLTPSHLSLYYREHSGFLLV